MDPVYAFHGSPYADTRDSRAVSVPLDSLSLPMAVRRYPGSR